MESLWGATQPTLTSLAGVGFEADQSLRHSLGTPAVPLTLLSPSTVYLPAFSWSGVSCLNEIGPADPRQEEEAVAMPGHPHLSLPSETTFFDQ